jgi:hypothetical protein
MGRPSEEQLLGPLHRPLREVNVSFEPAPPPEWSLNEAPAAEATGTHVRRWRMGTRDLLALAVATLVWLAVRSGDGLPFRSSEPAAPAAAGNVVRTTLAPDRADWKRTPRAHAKGPGSKRHGARDRDKNGSSDRGGKDHNPPTGGGGDDQMKPLLEATVPGVGTVTVDQPEVPTLPDADVPTVPAVPDAGDVLSGTASLPLP